LRGRLSLRVLRKALTGRCHRKRKRADSHGHRLQRWQQNTGPAGRAAASEITSWLQRREKGTRVSGDKREREARFPFFSKTGASSTRGIGGKRTGRCSLPGDYRGRGGGGGLGHFSKDRTAPRKKREGVHCRNLRGKKGKEKSLLVRAKTMHRRSSPADAKGKGQAEELSVETICHKEESQGNTW